MKVSGSSVPIPMIAISPGDKVVVVELVDEELKYAL